jgi:hypothetical protein
MPQDSTFDPPSRAFLYAGLSLIAAYFAWQGFIEHRRFALEGVHVQGTVTRWTVPPCVKRCDTSLFAAYVFRDSEGYMHAGTAQVPYELIGKLTIKGPIPVRYVKGDPTQNVPDYDNALSTSILGAIAFVVLNLMALASCRKGKSSERGAPCESDKPSPSTDRIRVPVQYPFC